MSRIGRGRRGDVQGRAPGAGKGEQRLACPGSGRHRLLLGWGTTVTAAIPLATPAAPATDPLAELGARELEVLGHLAQGQRNRAIAQQLHISESTVKFHVANILTKLNVESRGEAAALARAM
ncbi:response regulator transcription factor [Streptomyces sp. NPDC051644]|uniref:response regulator transcription factor n=1 Tax=Streptomyces sp. NPDC051644 TaxID=3365666 RepID=UPI0037884E0E